MQARTVSIDTLATVLFPSKCPLGLTHDSEKKAFQGHTGGAEREESHSPRICRISAATISRIRKFTEELRIPCNTTSALRPRIHSSHRHWSRWDRQQKMQVQGGSWGETRKKGRTGNSAPVTERERERCDGGGGQGFGGDRGGEGEGGSSHRRT